MPNDKNASKREKGAQPICPPPHPTNPPPMSELDFALADCMGAVGRACGMPISPEAAEYWINEHYRPRFHNAITNHCRPWSEDRPAVLKKAGILGRKAANKAVTAGKNKVLKLHAEAASAETDCNASSLKRVLRTGQRSKGGGVPQVLYVWCEPAPAPPPPPHPKQKKR